MPNIAYFIDKNKTVRRLSYFDKATPTSVKKNEQTTSELCLILYIYKNISVSIVLATPKNLYFEKLDVQ